MLTAPQRGSQSCIQFKELPSAVNLCQVGRKAGGPGAGVPDEDKQVNHHPRTGSQDSEEAGNPRAARAESREQRAGAPDPLENLPRGGGTEAES